MLDQPDRDSKGPMDARGEENWRRGGGDEIPLPPPSLSFSLSPYLYRAAPRWPDQRFRTSVLIFWVGWLPNLTVQLDRSSLEKLGVDFSFEA